MDNCSYISLLSKLEGHFNKTLDELPDELKSAVKQSYHLECSWDNHGENGRRVLVEQYDARKDPALEEEGERAHILGYYSIANEWGFWAGKPTLIAEEAVPLMNGCDPESWRERARCHGGLPDDMITAVERGLKIAAGEAATHKSPAGWLDWGRRHGLDQPTMKSDAQLRVPDVCMWPLFADAVERAASTRQGILPAKAQMSIPVQKQQQQESAILNWLKERNYDPQNLPVPPQGKSGVKKDCRDELCQDCRALFSSTSVFNTAWERLRANKEITDAKQN